MTEISCVAPLQSQLGEGPCWDPARQRLYWFDIKNRRLFALEDGKNIREWRLPARASAAAALADGSSLLISSEEGLWRFDSDNGACSVIEPMPEAVAGFRSNDGRADMAGNLWWSTMDDDGGKRPGAVWRFDGQRSRKMVEDVNISNCLSFSPDGRTMYMSDTAKSTIWAFDYDAKGATLTNRRVFTTIANGGPDGAAVDAEGYLWAAIWGGWRVERHAPDGTVDRVIEVPVEQPSSCIFGGPDLDILYITSAWDGLSDQARKDQPQAGNLFACKPGVKGLAIPPVRAEP
jgi:sugar lactone lactonase YvrE